MATLSLICQLFRPSRSHYRVSLSLPIRRRVCRHPNRWEERAPVASLGEHPSFREAGGRGRRRARAGGGPSAILWARSGSAAVVGLLPVSASSSRFLVAAYRVSGSPRTACVPRGLLRGRPGRPAPVGTEPWSGGPGWPRATASLGPKRGRQPERDAGPAGL